MLFTVFFFKTKEAKSFMLLWKENKIKRKYVGNLTTWWDPSIAVVVCRIAHLTSGPPPGCQPSYS